MVHQQAAPGKAHIFCQFILLLVLVVNWYPVSAQWNDDSSAEASDKWQTISNFTIVANGPVNYQLRSFTIQDQFNREVILFIQANNGPELIKDMKVCGNIAYSLDSRHIFAQPLNPLLFSAIGLYGPKILQQIGNDVIGGRRSLAFDEVHQVLLFSNQSRIQAFDYCSDVGVPKAKTIIYRGLLDATIEHIAIDSSRGFLLWSERSEADNHCRLMKATLDGQNIRELYESKSSLCTAMAVHVPSGHLYWVAKQTLWSLSYGGGKSANSARVILRNDNLISDSIQIDPKGDYIYWSSMQRKVVRMSLSDDSKEPKVQLISQLGGEHLLLVAFQVTETSKVEDDRHCLPLCTRKSALSAASSVVTTSTSGNTFEDTSNGRHQSSSPTTKPITWHSLWVSLVVVTVKLLANVIINTVFNVFLFTCTCFRTPFVGTSSRRSASLICWLRLSLSSQST